MKEKKGETIMYGTVKKFTANGKELEIKRYMVITVYEDETSANFFDNIGDANDYIMNAECGVGAYTEVYGYELPNSDNNYTSGYQLLWK